MNSMPAARAERCLAYGGSMLRYLPPLVSGVKSSNCISSVSPLTAARKPSIVVEIGIPRMTAIISSGLLLRIRMM